MDEIRSGPKTHFQNLLATITAELGKSMDERLIVHFHRDDDPLVRTSKEYSRDYGIALVRWAREDPSHQTVGKMGLPVLEDAVKTWPDDLMGMEYRAWALVFSGRLLDGVEAFKGVLEKSPKEESTLRDAAILSEIAGQVDVALDYWRRAIAINPTSAIYRKHLAKLLHDRKEWKEVLAECEATLKLNLADIDTYKVLVTCCVRLGDRSRARREFKKIMALVPKDPSQQPKIPGHVPEDPEKLKEWFAEQMK